MCPQGKLAPGVSPRSNCRTRGGETVSKAPPRNKKIYDRSTSASTPLPRPPAAKPDEIWKRINALVPDGVDPAATAEPDESPEKKAAKARRAKRRKRAIRVLDVTGTVVWAYALTKLFVGDFDLDLLHVALPQVAWLLDFRFFIALGVLALLLLLFKVRRVGLGLLYVWAYPLVILLWKVPAFLIKHRSKLALLGAAGLTGAISALYSLAARSRRFFIAFALGCISGLIIVFSDTLWLTVFGMLTMAVTLVWWLVVTAVDVLRTPKFIRAQEKLLKKILAWKVVENLITPEQPDRVSLRAWTAEDAKKYINSAGTALLAWRLLRFWAYALDQYRRGPSIVLTNAAIALGMIVTSILSFALINYAAFLIDPSGFHHLGRPDAATFLYYSFAGMYGGEIAALTPVGGLAVIAKLLTGFVGLACIGGLVVSTFLNFRASRADDSSTSAIQVLKAAANDLEIRSVQQFRLSFDDLEANVVAAGWTFVRAITWISGQTPTGWLDDVRHAPPTAE